MGRPLEVDGGFFFRVLTLSFLLLDSFCIGCFVAEEVGLTSEEFLPGWLAIGGGREGFLSISFSVCASDVVGVFGFSTGASSSPRLNLATSSRNSRPLELNDPSSWERYSFRS